MAEYPVFKKAPITEALLDIQVVLPREIGLHELTGFQEEVRVRFPNRQERSLLQFQLEARANKEPEVTQASGGVEGYLFISPMPDSTKIVQARLTGFAFSKLKPYQRWELFRSEARELWTHYTSVAHPIMVSRLGLRTINRIELPQPVNDLSKYLRTRPEIASELPSELAEFYMRLVLPQPDSPARAIVTAATDNLHPWKTFVPIIFDTDVFVEAPYEPESEAIWDMFEKMRDQRNHIFFNSITDTTKELFR